MTVSEYQRGRDDAADAVEEHCRQRRHAKRNGETTVCATCAEAAAAAAFGPLPTRTTKTKEISDV